MDNLSKATQGLRNVGYAPLLELMTPLNNKMADYIASNKEFIVLGMTKAVELLFKAFDLLKIGLDTGLIPVIITMKLAFEAAKLAIVAQTAVTTAYTVIQSILDVGLIATTKLIIAQNAAWLANPIGMVIVAMGALISAIILIYSNLETLDKWISNIYNWFTDLDEILQVIIATLGILGIVLLVTFAPVTATIAGILIALYALVKAYQYVKSKISGEPIETEIKPPEMPSIDPSGMMKDSLPGMQPVDRKNLQSANSGLLSQTINRNNNSNVVVDFKNLPQFANVTQKGMAPNISVNTGKFVNPFAPVGFTPMGF
jgi:hypothetical protein